MTRRIGLDLDHTIIDYALPLAAALEREGVAVAPGTGGVTSKQEAKRALLDRDGDEGWQRAQGWIYSAGIELAEAFPGVHEFLVRCAVAGDEVHIVSHKTEHGHFDASRRSLRSRCCRWFRSRTPRPVCRGMRVRRCRTSGSGRGAGAAAPRIPQRTG
ncbi:MAG: hypothetical protein KJS90_09970 [Acidobacteria bacterium]|nr:hypothetical protein [Acidobacteriota bacterium]